MIVGAPNGNSTDRNSGVICLCENVLDSAEKCSQVKHVDDFSNFTQEGANNNEEFGSSVVITKSGQLMICSPNWKHFYQSYTFLPGRCTLLEDFNDDMGKPFHPFFDHSRSKYIMNNEYNYGVASFGFSADSNKESVFVFGAPGVRTSQGTVTITDVNTAESNSGPLSENSLAFTMYGYLGYSVKIGRFWNGSDSDIYFAAGAPNGNRVGFVQLYKWKNRQNLKRIDLLSGEEKAWSSFGYSLSAVDVDNDGYDELLVGAPYFGDTSKDRDQGKVFIYSRSQLPEKLEYMTFLDGSRKKFARFGTAIQNIGDLNLDKYSDVAVGAPGENDGAGCVYIYLGGHAGLTNTPSQRITAEQVSKDLSKPIQGFGFAFSDHAIPLKENYPVFAATSVVDDTIVIFKSRHIVDVFTNLTADPNPVDMDKACSVTGISFCFNVSLCMKYTLRGGDNIPLAFQIGWDIDIQIPSNRKRALFRNNGSLVESFTEFTKPMIISNESDCVYSLAIIRENFVNQDRFTPVHIVAKYSLREIPSSDLDPILDATKPNNVSLTVTFLNKCGDDNKCEVDLRVLPKLHYIPEGNWDSIVVNETKELLVKVDVKNSKETSYSTVISVEIDSFVPYLRSDSTLCQLSTFDIAKGASSTALNVQQNTTVLCNYYKPLDQDGSFSLTVVFDTENIELNKKNLTIKVKAEPENDKNPEVNLQDNSATMTTVVEIIANVLIYGSSFPVEVPIYEYKLISLKDTGSKNKFRSTGKEVKPLNVTQKVLIKNDGPSFLPNTEVTVHVPMFLVDKTELINDAVVEITTPDGRVSPCNKNKTLTLTFPEQASSTPSEASTDKDSSRETTHPTGITSTDANGDIYFIPNKRRKRANDDNEKLNTNYTLDCDSNEDICQVFVCTIGTIIPSGSHAEINVFLVIDKANIPMPENYNAFHYSVQTNVKRPSHKLFKKWDSERLVKTVTKFQLIQSVGKINIWIIVGSVIAGLVLITIIVLIFWKLGFFKRDKHKQVEQWKHESKRRSKKGYSKAPNEEPGAEGSGLDAGDTKPGASL